MTHLIHRCPDDDLVPADDLGELAPDRLAQGRVARAPGAGRSGSWWPPPVRPQPGCPAGPRPHRQYRACSACNDRPVGSPSDVGNPARAQLIRRYRDPVAVQRVLRTRDRQWRVEFHDDGRVDVVRHGAKVLVRATLDQVGKRLASEGLDLDELVED